MSNRRQFKCQKFWISAQQNVLIKILSVNQISSSSRKIPNRTSSLIFIAKSCKKEKKSYKFNSQCLKEAEVKVKCCPQASKQSTRKPTDQRMVSPRPRPLKVQATLLRLCGKCWQWCEAIWWQWVQGQQQWSEESLRVHKVWGHCDWLPGFSLQTIPWIWKSGISAMFTPPL